MWGLGSPVAHFTLEGHDKGVNAIEYFTGGDKPYIISGADDKCAFAPSLKTAPKCSAKTQFLHASA